MSAKRRSLGAAELDVLTYVSEHFPVSVREVMQGLAETHGYARTTVLTVLERLREKGYLTRENVEGTNRYRPCVSQKGVMNSVIGRFVDEMLGGSVSPFLAYLNQSGKLTPDEMSELKSLVKKLDNQADAS